MSSVYPAGKSQFRQFHTTRWSMVVASSCESGQQSEEALQELCQTYWYPLYAFLRRGGKDADAAQDLTQAFFEYLLEKRIYEKADQDRGRFRTFLLTSLNNFVTNEWKKQQAQKRGGGQRVLSLNLADGESRFSAEPIDDMTAERLFERKWATTLLQQAIDRLRENYQQAGKTETFEKLLPHLGGTRKSYQESADELGVSLAAVRVAIHRLRKKCGEMLRAEIAQTIDASEHGSGVSGSADIEGQIDEELAHLRNVLG